MEYLQAFFIFVHRFLQIYHWLTFMALLRSRRVSTECRCGHSCWFLFLLDSCQFIFPPIYHCFHIFFNYYYQITKYNQIFLSLYQSIQMSSKKKIPDQEGTQMGQISNTTDKNNKSKFNEGEASLHSEPDLKDEPRESARLTQPIGPNSSLINSSSLSARAAAIPPANVSFYQRILNNKKLILKWGMVICILIFVLWMGSSFLDGIAKTRKPMFLSTFSAAAVPETMSPQESDYQSFRYFQKMSALATAISSQEREATKQEMQQFGNIKFKQFYNAYKVIRTIQLGKQFEKTQKQKEELNPDTTIQQELMDQYINRTQYFSDAVDQFSCGSCYSFPIAATVQYMYKKKYNITVKLSEQQLIDCAHDNPNDNGCQHGNITKGFEYVQKTGLTLTEDYPYRSITGNSFKCDKQTINKSKKLYKISGFKKLPSGNCQAIQRQLVKGNVVAAMINAGGLSDYSSGVFTDCKRFDYNHAITVVGQTQKNQWIVRNSWGKGFGNNGYFVMGRGNTCGVCAHSIVPILNLDQKNEVIPYDPKQEEKKEVENN